MTLAQIKDGVAAYLHRTTEELTTNSVDLGLLALNHVRQVAELNNNFGFTRKLAQVSVDGVTGGSLSTAVEYPVADPPVPVVIKTVVDVGVQGSNGGVTPVEWTTGEDSGNRRRADNPYSLVRIPTDAQAVCGPIGQRRFSFSGDQIFFFPGATNTTFTLLLDAYTFTPDWVCEDLSPTVVWTHPWVTVGSMYLMWAAVIHVNQLFKDFVFRQEGNLPPPQTLADQALANLITWDTFKYEQFRRHSR